MNTGTCSAGIMQSARDNNQDNCGIIGNGSRNIVANDNKNCQFNITQPTSEDRNELDELLYPDISKDALHDFLKSPPECHPGTRKTVRNAIAKWASDPDASPLLWLHGPAGVGKSVIAKTMCTNSSDQIRVVGTFFFSTSSDKSAATLIPTLAWQLAKKVPETEPLIVSALKSNRLLSKSQLEQQFHQLIVQPLKDCTLTAKSAGLVMVIDGMDECVDENMQRNFLVILKDAGEKGDLPLRFLICSRPEPRIRSILETTDDDDFASFKFQIPSDMQEASQQSSIPIDPTLKPQLIRRRYQVQAKIEELFSSVVKAKLGGLLRWRPGYLTILPSDARKLCQPMLLGVDRAYPSSEILDELDKLCPRRVVSRIQIGLSEECKADVKLYLTDKFEAVRRLKNYAITSKDIEDLVGISCGHFLYASTIVKLLDDPCWTVEHVLNLARSSALPTPDLDKLYSAILGKAGEVMRCEDSITGETDLAILKNVFGILIVLWENVQLANIPGSFPIIESLLVLKKDKLETVLRKMHSILDIIPGTSIRVYHRSFFEFLQSRNRSRCHYISYSVSLRKFLVLLTRFCLGYTFQRCCGQLQNDDKKQANHVLEMVLAFPRNFFRRSVNPTKLTAFHGWVHTFIIHLLWMSFFWLSLDFWNYLIVPRVSPRCVFFVRYLLIMVLFFPIAFASFVISLMCYMWYADRCIIYPLFHPFLHPTLVSTIKFLLS